MATHSNILAWRIPWTEEAGRLQSIGLQSRTQQEWLSSLLVTPPALWQSSWHQMGSLFPPLDREESCGCRGECTAEVMLCSVSGWGVEGHASCGSFSWDTLFWSLSCPVNHPPEVSTCVCVCAWWGVVPREDKREVSREPQPVYGGGWRSFQMTPDWPLPSCSHTGTPASEQRKWLLLFWDFETRFGLFYMAIDNWNRALKQCQTHWKNDAPNLQFPHENPGEMCSDSPSAKVDGALVRKFIEKRFSPACVHLCWESVCKEVEWIPLPLTRTGLGEAGTEVGQSNFPSIFLSSWLRLHKKRQINREKQAEAY